MLVNDEIPASEVAPQQQAERAGSDSEEHDKRKKSRWRVWAKVVVIALLTALVLRLFAFEAYRIPSESMEDTLLVGDFLFVSKLNYGARTPITLGIPFTDYYLEGVELPAVRLPGFGFVKRGDIIVFNYPPDEAPIDRKTSYIKRVIALPGDTILIEDKVVSVNGVQYQLPNSGQHMWRVHLEEPFAGFTAQLDSLGLAGRVDEVSDLQRVYWGTRGEVEAIRGLSQVDRIEPNIRVRGDRSAPFPIGNSYSLDSYGPVITPQRGWTVELNDETWPLYRRIITDYEGNEALQVTGGFEVSGALTSSYTFEQDYYFVLGDNRDDSSDSRSWGFVPTSHLVGKAVLIYFSWDPDQGSPRWDRMLRTIH